MNTDNYLVMDYQTEGYLPPNPPCLLPKSKPGFDSLGKGLNYLGFVSFFWGLIGAPNWSNPTKSSGPSFFYLKASSNGPTGSYLARGGTFKLLWTLVC